MQSNWTVFTGGPMSHHQLYELAAADLTKLSNVELVRHLAAGAAAIDCCFGGKKKNAVYGLMRGLKDRFGLLAREGLRRLGKRFPIPAADGRRMTQHDLLQAAEHPEKLTTRVLFQKFIGGAATIGVSFGYKDLKIRSLWEALDKLGHELLSRLERQNVVPA